MGFQGVCIFLFFFVHRFVYFSVNMTWCCSLVSPDDLS